MRRNRRIDSAGCACDWRLSSIKRDVLPKRLRRIDLKTLLLQIGNRFGSPSLQWDVHRDGVLLIVVSLQWRRCEFIAAELVPSASGDLIIALRLAGRGALMGVGDIAPTPLRVPRVAALKALEGGEKRARRVERGPRRRRRRRVDRRSRRLQRMHLYSRRRRTGHSQDCSGPTPSSAAGLRRRLLPVLQLDMIWVAMIGPQANLRSQPLEFGLRYARHVAGEAILMRRIARRRRRFRAARLAKLAVKVRLRLALHPRPAISATHARDQAGSVTLRFGPCDQLIQSVAECRIKSSVDDGVRH